MKIQPVKKVDNVYDQLRKKLKKGQSFTNSKGVVFTCMKWGGPKFFTASFTLQINEEVYRGGNLHIEVAISSLIESASPQTVSIEEIVISQLMNITGLWRAHNGNYHFSKSLSEMLVISQSDLKLCHTSAEKRSRATRITGECTVLDMIIFETQMDHDLLN